MQDNNLALKKRKPLERIVKFQTFDHCDRESEPDFQDENINLNNM